MCFHEICSNLDIYIYIFALFTYSGFGSCISNLQSETCKLIFLFNFYVLIVLAAETPFSSGGSRHNSFDQESEDDQEKNPNPSTPKARPFKFYQNSPKRREFLSKCDSKSNKLCCFASVSKISSEQSIL